MKGPQKSCCRDYANRKLQKLLTQGKHLGGQFVVAKLQGNLKVTEFRTKDKTCAEYIFKEVSRTVSSLVVSKRHYGESGLVNKGGRKFQIVVMLKEVEK